MSFLWSKEFSFFINEDPRCCRVSTYHGSIYSRVVWSFDNFIVMCHSRATKRASLISNLKHNFRYNEFDAEFHSLWIDDRISI